MKNPKSLLKVLLIPLIILSTTAFDFQSEKLTLRLDLKAKKTYKYEHIAEQVITQTIMGNEQTITQNITFIYDYQVLKKTSNKDYKIKITYTGSKLYQEMPNLKVDYDSRKDKKNIPEAAKAYAAVVGEAFTIFVSPLGKVTKIEGADEIIDNIVKKTNSSEEEKSRMKEMLKNQFGPNALLNNMQNTFTIYPEKALEEGDTWELTNDIKSGFAMVLDHKYELSKINENNVVLNVNTNLKSSVDESMKISGMEMRYDMTGIQSGTIKVDLKTGLTLKTKQKQVISGIVEMQMEGQDFNFPMKMVSNIEINRLD